MSGISNALNDNYHLNFQNPYFVVLFKKNEKIIKKIIKE